MGRDVAFTVLKKNSVTTGDVQ